jgi:hypothetical protein
LRREKGNLQVLTKEETQQRLQQSYLEHGLQSQPFKETLHWYLAHLACTWARNHGHYIPPSSGDGVNGLIAALPDYMQDAAHDLYQQMVTGKRRTDDGLSALVEGATDNGRQRPRTDEQLRTREENSAAPNDCSLAANWRDIGKPIYHWVNSYFAREWKALTRRHRNAERMTVEYIDDPADAFEDGEEGADRGTQPAYETSSTVSSWHEPDHDAETALTQTLQEWQRQSASNEPLKAAIVEAIRQLNGIDYRKITRLVNAKLRSTFSYRQIRNATRKLQREMKSVAALVPAERPDGHLVDYLQARRSPSTPAGFIPWKTKTTDERRKAARGIAHPHLMDAVVLVDGWEDRPYYTRPIHPQSTGLRDSVEGTRHDEDKAKRNRRYYDEELEVTAK